MATRLSDGINMVKACDAAGVKLFVVKQNRFNPTLQLLKNQLIKDRFGRLSMISVNVFWQNLKVTMIRMHGEGLGNSMVAP